MAKKFKNYEAHESVHHKTSIGRNASKAKMMPLSTYIMGRQVS